MAGVMVLGHCHTGLAHGYAQADTYPKLRIDPHSILHWLWVYCKLLANAEAKLTQQVTGRTVQTGSYGISVCQYLCPTEECPRCCCAMPPI
ncbi:hypothetical protein GCM10011317_35700 [Niveispirillum cyanobacteriorum]|nr:hypothetical protein GCM10011317_35700 [Niveispirillum cyanobacteriorum]